MAANEANTTSVESNANIVTIVYIVFTVVVDGLIHIALQLISTKGPGEKSKKSHHRIPSTIDEEQDADHRTTDQVTNNANHEPFQQRAYKYLFNAQYPMISNNDIKNETFENDQTNSNNFFVDTTAMRIFTDCTCFKYLKFSLQVWAFCSGFLALYLSLVFWGNLFAEFSFAAIGRSEKTPGSIFGLVAVYFLVEIIFWFLKRQIESIILITRNVGDIFNVKLILFWRIYDVVFIIICVGCTRVNSSVWFFQSLMLLMITRGLIWQLWHTAISFFGTIGIVLYKFKNDKENWLNWKEFLFVISNRPESMDECKWYKYIYAVVIWLLVIIFFAMIPVYKELFVFAGIIMIVYYLIILFDAGKYDMWYALWSGKYHSQYFGYKSYDNKDIFEEKGDTELVVVSNKYQKVSVVEEEDDTKQKQEETENKDTEENAEENKTNVDENEETIMMQDNKMVLLEYWEKVKYKHNHYMCSCCWCFCGGDCPPSKDDIIEGLKEFWVGLIKWICIAAFVLIIFLTVWYWLQPEGTATNPPTFTTNTVAPYESCNSLWAGYITIVDFIYLVKSSSGEYVQWDHINDPEVMAKNKETIQYQLDIWFGNETESGWNYNSLFLNKQPGFYHIRNEKRKIDLLINRPTATNMDIIQNIRLYGEACLFHIFSFAIPLSSLLPLSFITQFIDFASIPERLLSPTIHAEYDDAVYKYIINNIANRNGTTSPSQYFVQGGHSLGGGLTDIVGGRLYHNGYGNNYNNFSIINFGLGSPGTVWSSKKFGYDTEDIDKSTSISLIARRDLVSSLVDIHGGRLQKIRCIQPNSLDCHASTVYFCEFYRSCNHEQFNLYRNMTFTKCVCDQKFDFKLCW